MLGYFNQKRPYFFYNKRYWYGMRVIRMERVKLSPSHLDNLNPTNIKSYEFSIKNSSVRTLESFNR